MSPARRSSPASVSLRQRLWPLSALLVWACGWTTLFGLTRLGLPTWSGMLLGTLLGLGLAVGETTSWRRLITAGGFPLSLAMSGLGAGLPVWIWPLALGLLALLYPINTWRDAPLFPTPPGILEGLAAVAKLAPGTPILDAGCGLGAGLRELRRVYPKATLTGLEWSWPLRLLCGLRCPFAQVRRADIWKENWSGYSLVYMFQRPESMGPAASKARAELPSGAWLVSLEFEATSITPVAVLRNRADKPVWIYRMP